MARQIDTTLTGLSKASPTVSPGSTGTIAFWFKPDWSSGDSAAHYMFNFLNTAETNRFTMLKYSDNNIYAGWVVSPTDYRITIADTGLFTAGTWAHWALAYNDSANTETLYKNGSVVSHRTSALVTGAAADLAVIGNYKSTNVNEGGDGAIAEVGFWSNNISTDDLGRLTQGFSPLMISPSTLTMYLPLVGGLSPEVNVMTADAFSVTSAPASEHPRIFYPSGGETNSIAAYSAPAAVGSSLIAWF